MLNKKLINDLMLKQQKLFYEIKNSIPLSKHNDLSFFQIFYIR